MLGGVPGLETRGAGRGALPRVLFTPLHVDRNTPRLLASAVVHVWIGRVVDFDELERDACTLDGWRGEGT